MLTRAEVDRHLQDLSEAVAIFVADTTAAEREFHLWADRSEALIGEPDKVRGVEPAVVGARREIASAHWARLRWTHHEMVAWWADLAAWALVAEAQGLLLFEARAAAAEPGRYFDPEMLACLPPVDEHTRKLIELALHMGPDPTGADDLAASASEIAERAGFVLRQREDGSIKVVEDPMPEARRRQLWGALWTDHHIPDLPCEPQLTELLSDLGVPNPLVAEVGAAVQEYGRLRQTAEQLSALTPEELWEASPDEDAGHEVLRNHLDTAPDVLTHYARDLSKLLLALRDYRDRAAEATRS